MDDGRDLKADLIELAAEGTDDLMEAVAALVSAAATLLGAALGPHAAASVLRATVMEATSRASS